MTVESERADNQTEKLYYQLMRDQGIPWMERLSSVVNEQGDEDAAIAVWVATIYATQKVMASVAASLFSGRVEPARYEEVADTFTKDMCADMRRLLITRREMQNQDRPPEASVH